MRMRGYYVITLSATTQESGLLIDFSSIDFSLVSEALAQVGKGEIFRLHPPYIISASLAKFTSVVAQECYGLTIDNRPMG